jgi:hypothetical protein
MPLRRSERRKTSSLQQLSDLKEPASLTTPATSNRKRKVQLALKDRAEAFLAKVADPPANPSVANRKKRKLGDLQDENPSKAPARHPQDLHSVQSSTKTKPRGKPRAAYDGTPKQDQEKRLRRYRDKAPQSFLEKLHRARTQRYVSNVNRNRFPVTEQRQDDCHRTYSYRH